MLLRTRSTPQVFVSECCGALFLPGHGPDNIVEADVGDHADARRETACRNPKTGRKDIFRGKCPACGERDPQMTEVDGL
ncbi:hypothetical protein GCM10009039_15050 [Halocalculus aciditolerans]|uniref:Uncharacterized protein n=1 Tax=Halocalculus aciditolerans TaxID=1383812 RepID=A0A830FIA0_9EURY|nr:hypothetical protein GCM10009039_15050 [Halocalculus aciditolerans]